MKTTKKIIMLLIFALLIVLSTKVNATSISASPSSPKVGQAVTITVSVPNVNTVDLTATVSGAGTSGTIRIVDGSMTGEARTFSKSITVTPTSAGTINVSVSSGSNAVLNGSYVGVSASKSITVTAASSEGSGNSGSGSGSNNNKQSNTGSGSSTSNKPATTQQTKQEEVKKSDVNTLSSIVVEGYELMPEFNKDVREYRVSVPHDVNIIDIKAVPTDSKATVTVEGNENLIEGENTVSITVTAEDGSTSKYIVKAYKGRVPLALKTLVVKYTNKDGEVIELPLNPIFNPGVLEYTLEDLEYFIENLDIETEANLPNVTFEITGADKLVEGENVINITLRVKETSENVQEGEEQKEEIITYTIKVNKAKEPSFMAKVKDKLKGIFGGISTWYNNNQKAIVVCSLCTCLVFLSGLSIYIVVDYQKYKILLEKIAKLEQVNSAEPVKVIQSQEQSDEMDNQEEIKEVKAKGGKHF